MRTCEVAATHGLADVRVGIATSLKENQVVDLGQQGVLGLGVAVGLLLWAVFVISERTLAISKTHLRMVDRFLHDRLWHLLTLFEVEHCIDFLACERWHKSGDVHLFAFDLHTD